MKRKKLFIGLGIVFGIIIILLAIFFALSMPEKSEPIASGENTNLYIILSSAGITDAVIDITEKRAFIRYELPDFINKTNAVYYILGAAASVAPNTKTIIIQTYQNFEPVDEVTVSTSEVISFSKGEISEEEFLKKIS